MCVSAWIRNDIESKLTKTKRLPWTITQIQVLGETTGLAICKAVLNKHVRHGLTLVLSPQQITSVLQSVLSIRDLDASGVTAVRRLFAQGYNQQVRIMM